jgi:hypothetical protein
LGISVDPCTEFHGGINETNPKLSCDCNANLVRDLCDIEPGGGSFDTNTNGIPDECEAGPVPTASEWGLIVMGLMTLVLGTLVFSRRRTMVRGS